jgi:hypothetical protein
MRSKNAEWAKTYHKKVLDHNVKNIFANKNNEIFALQELSNGHGDKSKSAGKPLGDSAMFSAVMSLMKAQYYELSVRHKKERKKPNIYQFNLLSIVDGEMMEFKFSDDPEITAKHISFANYIARYIFNGAQTFARIAFTTYNNLDNTLDQYEKLHAANQKIFSEVVGDFYDSIVEDTAKIKVFEKDFLAHLTSKIRFVYIINHRSYDKLKIDSIWHNKETSTLELGIENSFNELDFLNDKCLELAKDAAKLFFKYSGKVIFDESLPF